MNKNSKKIIALSLCAVLVSSAVLTGCNKDSGNSSNTSSETSATQQNATESNVELIDVLTTTKKDAKVYKDTEHEIGYQLEKPNKGDEIAIMHTNMGDIYMRFFKEAAPKTVENFLTHAKDGYYDGVTFHRVIDEFMIQGGDPEGNGTGGESIWGGSFEDEFSDHLFNIRGSVAMANSGMDTNGSQFFINQGGPETFAQTGWDSLETNWAHYHLLLSKYYNTENYEAFAAQMGTGMYDTDLVSQEVRDLYTKYGGNPMLDGAFSATDRGHTVFAQVYDGMDVVDEIAKVQTDSNDKPVKDVVIESIEVKTYEG